MPSDKAPPRSRLAQKNAQKLRNLKSGVSLPNKRFKPRVQVVTPLSHVARSALLPGQPINQLGNWTYPDLKEQWVPHDTRDEVVDYVNRWSAQTELPKTRLIGWLSVGTSKFYQWQDRYGQANEHNGRVPRDSWLEDWERRAILDFQDRHPLEGKAIGGWRS